MSLSEILIKLMGLALAVVGFLLILSGVGFLDYGFSPWYWDIIVGVILMGAGIYIVRGGNFTI